MAHTNFDRNKSIEQLKGDVWKDFDPPQNLEERVHHYRKIPIAKLTVEELRLLIGQNEGLEYLIPVSLEILRMNILAEGDMYKGDLLSAVLTAEEKFWYKTPTLKHAVIDLIVEKQNEIQEKNEDNKYRQLLKKMEIFKFK